MRVLVLRVALVARCLLCLFFAWRLYEASATSAGDLAGVFSEFVLLDGVLALVLAWLVWIAGWHRGVAGIAALDGVMRLSAYLALYLAPGIPGFAVTAVVFAGLLAVFGFLFGVLDVVEANHLRRETGFSALTVILGVAGLGTIALAVTQFFVEPSIERYRDVLMAGALLQSLTMLAVAVLVGRSRKPAQVAVEANAHALPPR